MRIVSGIMIAAAIMATPVIWHAADNHFASPAVAPIEALDTTAIDAELASLRADVTRLQDRVNGLDSRTSLGFRTSTVDEAPETERPPVADTLRNSFAQVVLIADRRSANEGLTVASPRFLRDTFGLPRNDLNQECQSATNPKLRALLATEDVGPIRARMIAPALDSIRQVFANIEIFEPDLYAMIESSGSLCVRLIRGSTSSASAHAYGLAVDINIDGQLDNFADGKTQLGLILLADFFKKEGWIWGAGFSREDSMHFEVSREKLEQWRQQGLI